MAAASIVVLGGCGSGKTGGRGSPSPAAPRAGIAAAAPIQPSQQLQSSTLLQSDLDALNNAATERDLQDAVAKLQEDLQAVAGSQPTAAAADWQKALAALQQVNTDVAKLAAAHSATPTAQNPLKSGASGGGAKPVQDILNEIKDGFNLLSTVVKDLAFTIKINNLVQPKDAPNGRVHAPTHTGGPYPAIDCGLDVVNGEAKDNCSAVVLALQGVALTFDPEKTGDPKITFQIGTITSNPAGSCIAKYNATDPDKGPGSSATCSVSAGAGKTVTITPSWVKAQPPPSG